MKTLTEENPISHAETAPLAKRAAGSRERQREDTRRAVLDAAISLFSQRGFEGTALPAIAAACGVPVPLMLYHFKSKDALWRDAVSEVYGRVEAHIEQFRTAIEAAQGLEFYRLCSRAHITALAAHLQYMRILFQEGTQESERLTWLVETHQNRMSAVLMYIIGRAQSEGLLPQMDLPHAKFILSGAFCLPIVLAAEFKLVTGEDSLSEAFIERHIDLCLRVVLPAAALDAPSGASKPIKPAGVRAPARKAAAKPKR